MLEDREQEQHERRRFEKLQGEVFGVDLSTARASARAALRSTSDARALQRQDARARDIATPPRSSARFSETVVQPRIIQQYAFPESHEAAPFPQAGTTPGGYPTDEGEYTYTVDSFGDGAWTVRKLPPDIPDGVSGEDNIFALRRNSTGDPEWYKEDTVEIPDCSSGTTVYREVFAKPPPGP